MEAETDKNLALERKKIAADAENRATALKQEADKTKNDAERMMQQAQIMVAEAKIKENEAKTIAAKETERRKGIEAMFIAGVPLRFPLEDDELENHEQGNNAPKQGDTPSPPVSSSAAPLSGDSNPGHKVPHKPVDNVILYPKDINRKPQEILDRESPTQAMKKLIIRSDEAGRQYRQEKDLQEFLYYIPQYLHNEIRERYDNGEDVRSTYVNHYQNSAEFETSNPVNAPKRTAKDILREVRWIWCLQGEFGIESESGKLIGEVTEKERTGYRASLQGNPLSDQEYIPPFGAFRANLLSPTEITREFWENKKDGHQWSWEDWYVFRTTTDKMKNALNIPPGHTLSLPKNEIPLHGAKLDRRYMLAQVPVTQELWESVMGNNPSHFKGQQRPVENVSWDECQDFIAKLNGMKTELGVPQDYEFTLPFESEWELACRATSTHACLEKLGRCLQNFTPFHTSMTLNDKQANFNSDRHFWTDAKKLSFGGTSVVGTYPQTCFPNPWRLYDIRDKMRGFYDMHGNVWEWCQDACGYGPLYVEGRASILDGFYRSRRGGSWSSFAENCHSAYRSFGNPLERHDDVGFRLCLAAIRSE